MKRLRLWALTAALTAAGGSTAIAGPPVPGEQTTLMNKLFGPKPPKPGPSAVPATPDRPLTISTPIPREVLADALRAEQDAYLRRVSVCTELRRVAVERGDDALARQADELERQAMALYNARVAGLGVSRVRASLPEQSQTAVVKLDEPATPREAASLLTAPAAPVPTSTAQIREVKP